MNGQQLAAQVDTRTTLLDVLRETFRLTDTKKGCDHGQCGAYTVLVNGRRINSCLSLAVMYEGDRVTGIEGLGAPDDLHPMQAAFIKYDGYHCGYCTPGQICSAVAVLEEIKGRHFQPCLGKSDRTLGIDGGSALEGFGRLVRSATLRSGA